MARQTRHRLRIGGGGSLARLVATAAILLAAAACGPAGGDPPRATIRVAYPGPPDFDDLPSLIAHKRLREAGYEVTEVALATSEQSAEALARGDIDFANGAMRSFWAARSRGADVVTLMTHVGNVHRLVARRGVTQCEDLADHRVALHSEGGATTALFRAYLAEVCPDVRVGTLLILRSENRAAALLSGRLHVAVLELSAFGWLEEQAPGEFHVLGDFLARWPHLAVNGVHVNRSFMQSRPGVVHDYLRARVEADRDVMADPARLVEEADRALGPSPAWASVARAYVDSGLWGGDGGLTATAVEESLPFYQQRGGLDPKLSATDVADVTILERVREALGPWAREPNR